jgi:hypothetical protein
VVLLGTVRSSKPVVPANTLWRFDGAQLCFGAEPCTPAVGVLWPDDPPRDPALVWATDTRLLWSFAADSGEQLGCAVVTDPTAPDPAQPLAPDDDPPSGTVPDDTAPDDDPPDTTAISEGPTCEPAAVDPTTSPTGTTTAPDEENN